MCTIISEEASSTKGSTNCNGSMTLERGLFVGDLSKTNEAPNGFIQRVSLLAKGFPRQRRSRFIPEKVF
jgi:hypothetical protein